MAETTLATAPSVVMQTFNDEIAEALIAPLMSEYGRYSEENNDIGKALIRLIDLFAYEQDGFRRDNAATILRTVIFLHTDACARSAMRFAEAAGAGCGVDVTILPAPRNAQ